MGIEFLPYNACDPLPSLLIFRGFANRSLTVPGKAVAEAVDLARESGTKVRKNAEEIYDNSFALHVEKSGFLKELWGSEIYKRSP